MDQFIEIAKYLKPLFCLSDEDTRNQSAYYLQKYFSTLARTSPELLRKRIDSGDFDLLIIDCLTPLNAQLAKDIEKIQTKHPSIMIFIEVDKEDTARMIEAVGLNVDKLLFANDDKKIFIKQLQRALMPRYELYENVKYEAHLEGIIFGQTNDLYTQQTSDHLTGFKNITALKEHFKDKTEKGLLFLDIDKFDTINTLYGMKIGDEVLRFVSKRLANFLPNNAELFRISADEFVVLLKEPPRKQMENLAQQIISFFLEAPIMVEGLKFDIAFSIGMDRGTAYEIFYNSKLANREAKSLGGRTSVAYTQSSRFLHLQKENHFWVNALKDALKEDRVLVYYQPMYDFQTKTINKYESLVRLEMENGDIISPYLFLKPAMLAQLLTQISRVVIDKAFKYFAKSQDSFSLNLTEQDFAEGYLLDFLRYKCEYYNIAPSRVYIEILEETSVKGSEEFLDQIKALKREGFKISIDDFGVEKSNFSRVVALQAEIIKIDGSFIRNLINSESSQIIVESIVAFSDRIGAKTVAEFVENEETFDLLEKMGVDYAQGYHIGRPQPQRVSGDMRF